jgi:hypothetical protein
LAIVRANECIALLDVVSNISTTSIRLWNAVRFSESLYFSACKTIMLDIHLRNANINFNLNLNEIHILAINMSKSSFILQNGTFKIAGSIHVPESSTLKLDRISLYALSTDQQLSMTIQGKSLHLNHIKILHPDYSTNCSSC